MPSIAPAMLAPSLLRGISLAMSSAVTNTSIKPDATEPNSKNGAASMKMPRKDGDEVLGEIG